ncbi:kifbp [Symbiodinium sp. CCMP2456]|nr:kifbp [Symbiodinium sp. CCMP2456]
MPVLHERPASVTWAFASLAAELAEDGTTAEKVEKDHASTYLIGKLNRARLRTKMRGLPADDNIEEHKLALKEYEEILQYGDRNPEVVDADVNMSMELKLCAEMVGLLPTKLARLAKRRSR